MRTSSGDGSRYRFRGGGLRALIPLGDLERRLGGGDLALSSRRGENLRGGDLGLPL